MTKEYAKKTWFRFLTERFGLRTMPLLDVQDALLGQAPSVAGSVNKFDREPGEVAEARVNAGRLCGKDDDGWVLKDAVGTNSDKPVGVKRRSRELRDMCGSKKQNISGFITDVLALAEEMLDRAVDAAPFGTVEPEERLFVRDLMLQVKTVRTEADRFFKKVAQLEQIRKETKLL